MASLTLDWLQLAALIGALQGLLLAALMAAFTVYLASTVYFSAAIIYTHPHFFGVGYQMPWIFGPLVYLYAVAASDRSWRFGPRTLIHFVPVLVTLALAAPYYMMTGAEKIAYTHLRA